MKIPNNFWKPLAICATVGQVIVLGQALYINRRANQAVVESTKQSKRAHELFDLMVGTANGCTNALNDDSLDLVEKLRRISEQFEFVQVVLGENGHPPGEVTLCRKTADFILAFVVRGQITKRRKPMQRPFVSSVSYG